MLEVLELCDGHTQPHEKHAEPFLTELVPPSMMSYINTQIIVCSLDCEGKNNKAPVTRSAQDMKGKASISCLL